MKADIAQLAEGGPIAKNEKGTDAFYDFEVTPASSVIPSYQHIWNPLTAEVTKSQRTADVSSVRITMCW